MTVMTMAEYIDREAVIEKFRRMLRVKHGMNERFFADSVFAVIENFPAADVVPVVRCKDCIHSYDDLCGLCCTCGPYVDCVVHPEFYCADGKKKGG